MPRQPWGKQPRFKKDIKSSDPATGKATVAAADKAAAKKTIAEPKAAAKGKIKAPKAPALLPPAKPKKPKKGI